MSVELYAPTQSDLSDDFQCGYKIEGIGAQKVKFAYGVDSLQALLLAMQSIGADLYSSDAAKTGQLRWLGQLDLGIPVPKSIEDLVPKSG